MKLIFAITIALILFLSALAIGAQNEQVIEVSYLIAKSDIRVSSLMAICLLLGGAMTFVMGCFWFAAYRWRVSRTRKAAE